MAHLSAYWLQNKCLKSTGVMKYVSPEPRVNTDLDDIIMSKSAEYSLAWFIFFKILTLAYLHLFNGCEQDRKHMRSRCSDTSMLL